MSVSKLFQREVDAVKRDLSRKGRRLTTDQMIAEADEYPSLIDRARRIEYKAWRFKENVVNLPYNTRQTVHKIRFGWDDYSTYAFDYDFAKRMDGIIGAIIDSLRSPDSYRGAPISILDKYGDPFSSDFEYPDEAIEEWLSILTEIRIGFHNYVIFEENSTYVTPDYYMEAYDEMMKGVSRSFALLAEWYVEISL